MAYIHSSNTEEVTNFKRSLLPFINSCTCMINGMLLSSKWCRLLILFIMLKKDPLFINNLITRMNEWCGIRFNSIMRYRFPTWNNKTMLFNKDLRQVSNSWLNCILFFHSYSHTTLNPFFSFRKVIYLPSLVSPSYAFVPATLTVYDRLAPHDILSNPSKVCHLSDSLVWHMKMTSGISSHYTLHWRSHEVNKLCTFAVFLLWNFIVEGLLYCFRNENAFED